jgi:DNA topoisomerase I
MPIKGDVVKDDIVIKKSLNNDIKISDINSIDPDFIAQFGELTLKPTYIQNNKIPEIIKSESEAKQISQIIKEDCQYKVIKITNKEIKTNPKPPFTTSTLQQAASNYGYSPKATMKLAQQLYETGYITYMRTDSVTLSEESVSNIRQLISNSFKGYLSDKVNKYANKKSAQEAHEAIRPTDPFKTPKTLVNELEPQALKVYDLIWRQSVACQMLPEIRKLTTFDLENSQKTRFSGSYSQVLFLGWKVLFKGLDTENNKEKEARLKQLWLQNQ